MNDSLLATDKGKVADDDRPPLPPVGGCRVSIAEQLLRGISEPIRGEAQITRTDAQAWGALAACRRLHNIGVLDDHLRVAGRSEALEQLAREESESIVVPRCELPPGLVQMKLLHDALDNIIALAHLQQIDHVAESSFQATVLECLRFQPMPTQTSRVKLGEGLTAVRKIVGAVKDALPEIALEKHGNLLTHLRNPDSAIFHFYAIIGGEYMPSHVLYHSSVLSLTSSFAHPTLC